MISIDDILQWKQAYGELYQMQIQEQHFIFRPLGREEYRQIILMDLDLGEFQETICFQAVIYPEDYDYSKGIAGIAEVLCDAILDASGLHIGQAKELLDAYRQEMLNYDYQVDCLIHEAFPEFTLEEISSWPVRKTMYYLSRAEWILRNLKGVMLQTIDEVIQQDYQTQQMPTPPMQQPMPEHRPQPMPQPPAPEGGIQSEEAVLAMLAQSGAKVVQPSASLDEVMPELSWFEYIDELKGEFD
jgi:hypothetical protein